MTNHRTIFAITACATLILSGATAFAHLRLLSATPAVNGAVRTAPNEVMLRFNERLESAFSSVAIRDSEGKQVDKGDSKLDKADRRIMRVSLPPLTAGVYKVEWQAMSADTHKVEGDFTFRIGQ